MVTPWWSTILESKYFGVRVTLYLVPGTLMELVSSIVLTIMITSNPLIQCLSWSLELEAIILLNVGKIWCMVGN